MPNRLALESSPYLRQHADNPVDWYAWDEAAFARAREEDKPIFLSIGYSTCHWCHVMEHESFENEDIAHLLNANFVSIKVDREERPDVDRVYMLFVQATTGSGGWPMSVWLTPELKPFFGGTYFPPTSRWGHPGFRDVLTEIARVWREDRPRVLGSAEEVYGHLRRATATRAEGVSGIAGADVLTTAADAFRRTFDHRHGGFGSAPKFPRASELLFLLRQVARTADGELLQMVGQTLRGMSTGGMRDHVGGGFHRYAVDAAWHVPHFEKMLYDQAQIALALLETAQASGDRSWVAVAEDTFEYVRRKLTDPPGGFYSAEDADSIPPESAGMARAPKREGAFYLWSADEVDRLLGAEAAVVKRRFGIEPGGNVGHDPQGEFGTKNILYIAASIEEVAAAERRDPEDVVRVLDESRQRMNAARDERPHPHLDDKVLVAWNGLMIAALARAGRVASGRGDGPGAGVARVQAAERAAEFLRDRMWRPDSKTLLRRYREGNAAIDAFAEDYACLIWSVLELFQATGAAAWLEWAIELQEAQDRLFWDESSGAWFNSAGTDPAVLLRIADDYDGAEPSASSVGVGNLLVLSHLIPRDEWRRRIDRVLHRASMLAREQPRSIPFMLCSLAAYHAGLTQIVIVGPAGRHDTSRLHEVVARQYLPFAITVPVEPGERQQALARLLPFIGSMTMRDGRATAYVCRDFTCDEPVTDPDRLTALLGRSSAVA